MLPDWLLAAEPYPTCLGVTSPDGCHYYVKVNNERGGLDIRVTPGCGPVEDVYVQVFVRTVPFDPFLHNPMDYWELYAVEWIARRCGLPTYQPEPLTIPESFCQVCIEKADACDQSWPPSYAIPGQPLPVSSRKAGTELPDLFQRITLQPHAGEELT